MYRHNVQYYETDKMGITHHSNYIRWMEEARIDFLEQLGYGYARMEEEGMVSPVISVDCDYRKPTTFPDAIDIRVTVEEYRGVRLKLHYEMFNQEGELVCDGHSGHAFLNAKGFPLRLAREFPEFHQILKELVERNTEVEK